METPRCTFRVHRMILTSMQSDFGRSFVSIGSYLPPAQKPALLLPTPSTPKSPNRVSPSSSVPYIVRFKGASTAVGVVVGAELELGGLAIESLLVPKKIVVLFFASSWSDDSSVSAVGFTPKLLVALREPEGRDGLPGGGNPKAWKTSERSP